MNEIPSQNTYYFSDCVGQNLNITCSRMLLLEANTRLALCPATYKKIWHFYIAVCVHARVSICPQAATCQPCKACNGLILMNVNIIYLFNNNLLTAGWHLVIIQLDGSGITCLLLYLLNLILFLHYFYRILAYYCYNFVLGVINLLQFDKKIILGSYISI